MDNNNINENSSNSFNNEELDMISSIIVETISTVVETTSNEVGTTSNQIETTSNEVETTSNQIETMEETNQELDKNYEDNIEEEILDEDNVLEDDIEEEIQDENISINMPSNHLNFINNVMNLITGGFSIQDNYDNLSSNIETNSEIDNNHAEIMNYAYENMMNLDDDIIKLIDFCYLKNLQYDDEPIDTIRYTIRTVFHEGSAYELKKLVSNIFCYSMTGINLVFNENFDLLNEILNSEIKRLLRRSMTIQVFSQMFSTGFQQMEDIKLVVTEEELEKIPTCVYKDLSIDIQKINEKCAICQEEYRENDNVRILECKHAFHNDCVDNWLTGHSHKCPCCRKPSANYKPKL